MLEKLALKYMYMFILLVNPIQSKYFALKYVHVYLILYSYMNHNASSTFSTVHVYIFGSELVTSHTTSALTAQNLKLKSEIVQ
jgi:hypothetical protein